MQTKRDKQTFEIMIIVAEEETSSKMDVDVSSLNETDKAGSEGPRDASESHPQVESEQMTKIASPAASPDRASDNSELKIEESLSE